MGPFLGPLGRFVLIFSKTVHLAKTGFFFCLELSPSRRFFKLANVCFGEYCFPLLMAWGGGGGGMGDFVQPLERK